MTGLLAVLILVDIEGLACLLWAFLTPSESGSSTFLWLSPGRLVLAVILLLVLLTVLSATLILWRGKRNAERVLQKLDIWCLAEKRLAGTLIVLVAVPLLLFMVALKILGTPLEYSAYQSWAPDTFPLLHSIITAILPLLTLGILICVESAAGLVVRYRRNIVDRRTWAWDGIAPALMGLLVAISLTAHWTILAFQLRFFVNIPAWYWIFDPLPFTIGDMWFALAAMGLLALICWTLVANNPLQIGLPALFFFGWFLQFGVGIMGGEGIATLRERYFTTYHQAYVAKATEAHETVLESIRRYEQLYGASGFTSTKPPGLMAFYIGLEHLVNGYPSNLDETQRYQRFSDVITWLFPLLAAGMVGLLYAFARRFELDASGFVPLTAPLLYVLAPSVALFTFFVDQAIYPAVFLLGVWLTIIAINRQSLAWAVLLGSVIYAAAFFAFSMLPLYPFAGLFLILYYWQHRPSLRWQKGVMYALAMGAGTLLLFMLFRGLLSYDFVPRFRHTMTINHNFDFYLRVGSQLPPGPEPFGVRLGQIANAAWINNLDFAAAIGFPLYILFLAQAARRVGRFFKGHFAAGDIILLALLASFIVLNLAGTAQGEVPRLWLFWLPMVAIFAAFELKPIAQRRPLVLFGLGMAQLTTLVLTFHFQDLSM